MLSDMQAAFISPAPPGTSADLVAQLNWSLRPIAHDRWRLGALRDRRLRVVAESEPSPNRPYQRLREVRPHAWRSLLSAEPVFLPPTEPHRCADPDGEDWEGSWPAVLYAPVSLPGWPAEGVLVIGNRGSHWYGPPEIDYVSWLAHCLLTWVAAAAGSQSALDRLVAPRDADGRGVGRPPAPHGRWPKRLRSAVRRGCSAECGARGASVFPPAEPASAPDDQTATRGISRHRPGDVAN